MATHHANDSPDSALVDAYLRHIASEKHLAERTQQLYIHDLQRLLLLAQNTGIQAVQAENFHLRAWIAQLHAQGSRPRTLALTLSVWRGWYAWLGRSGHIASNPCTGLRPPKRAQTLPKALAVDEAITLADFASRQAENTNRRNVASRANNDRTHRDRSCDRRRRMVHDAAKSIARPPSRSHLGQ